MSGLKRKLLYPDFSDYINKFDIICLSETHLDKFDSIYIPGYQFYSKERKQKYRRKSGGIGILVKNTIVHSVSVIDCSSEYILCLKFKQATHTDPVIIGAIYVPPENSRFINEDLLIQFEDVISELCSNYKHVYLLGDFNGRTGRIRDYVPFDPAISHLLDIDNELLTQYETQTQLEQLSIPLERKSLDNKTNVNGFRLIDICRNNNLFILNGRLFKDKNIGNYTFRDKSVIDYAIASADCFEHIINFEIFETDPLFSDGHNAIHLTIYLLPVMSETIETKTTTSCKPPWQCSLSQTFSDKIDINSINNIIHDLTTSQEPTMIELATQKIASIFKVASENTFTNTTNGNCWKRNKNDKPWFGPKCKKLRTAYNKARLQYNNNKSNRNRSILNKASKTYKKTMNFFISKDKLNKQNQLRNMNNTNPKQYWKYLKSLKPKQTVKQQPNLNELYNHFESINTKIINDNKFDNIENIQTNNSLNEPISENEILKCIKNLNNGKASSPFDNIINEHIKSTKDIFIKLYHVLFNSVLNTGYVPKPWLEGVIFPIYKNKGCPNDVNNYRPITILSCLGKLFTSIINNRLNVFLEESNTLDENQAGFRKFYSCSDHIFTLHALIEIMKKRKMKLFCAFIDFSQAFDTVWRAGLWSKLLNSNINGKVYQVIYNMYSNIKSCISLNGNFSNFFVSNIGVRQGENLSPLLFSLFLNDVQSYLCDKGAIGIELYHHSDIWLKLLILLYADDTVILANSATDLQNSLHSFNNYCTDWHMKVNTNKTKIIVFGSRRTSNLSFIMGKESIEIVHEYHYLGVRFSSNGSFLKARKHVAEQANKALHLLYSRVSNADLPIDLILKLFDNTVMPILLYGAEVYGYEDLTILERVHCNFLRKITKARKSTPLNFLYGELGRFPISITIYSRMIKFWSNIITGKQTKITNKIYTYIKHNHNNLNLKWITNIKTILQTVGRQDLWENQNTLDLKHAHKLVKQILHDQFLQNWHSELSTSNKGRIYLSFKDSPHLETYFKCLKKNEILNLFKYRTANHSLPVETGRYESIPYEDRLCSLCTLNQIGNEEHYLLVCPFFNAERRYFISSHTSQVVNNKSLKDILTNDNLEHLKRLSNYIHKVMNTFLSLHQN